MISIFRLSLRELRGSLSYLDPGVKLFVSFEAG
jgi:hypothetical protein